MPGTSLSTNVGRTIHAGVEMVAGASLPFDDAPAYGDNDRPAAPDYAIRGELMYRNDAGFFARPSFDLIGARYADSDSTCYLQAS